MTLKFLSFVYASMYSFDWSAECLVLRADGRRCPVVLPSIDPRSLNVVIVRAISPIVAAVSACLRF